MLGAELSDVPKKEWEYAAKDRFLAYLKRTKGEEWAHIVATADRMEALRAVDLESLSNIDRIYFEPAIDQIGLVFERGSNFVISEHDRNRLAAEANDRFVSSGIDTKDVYRTLEK